MHTVAELVAKTAIEARGASGLRKREICIALTADSAPYFDEHTRPDGSDDHPTTLLDIVLDLWATWNETPAGLFTYRDLEGIIPEIDDSTSSVYAQNSAICAVYMSKYLSFGDDDDLEKCILSYFDNIDYMSQEAIDADGESSHSTLEHELMNSNLFREKVNFFASLITGESPYIPMSIESIKLIYRSENEKMNTI